MHWARKHPGQAMHLSQHLHTDSQSFQCKLHPCVYIKWKQTTFPHLSFPKWCYCWLRCQKDNWMSFLFSSELQLPTKQDKRELMHSLRVSNWNVKTDRNVARLDHQLVFFLTGNFVPSGRQTCTWELSELIWTSMWHCWKEITFCNPCQYFIIVPKCSSCRKP